MAGCDGCDGCGHCECKRDLGSSDGWVPVKYYIMYEYIMFAVSRHDNTGNWKLVRRVKLLKNVADEEKAKIEAEKWLREMRKRERESNTFKLESAQLVASTHKDILKLT